MPDLAELLRQALMGQSAGGVVPQLAGADVPYAQQPRIQITPRTPDGPEPYGFPPSLLADMLRSALMGPSAGGVAPQIAGMGAATAAPGPLGIPPMPPRSALDTSGMGALTPPDTFIGRAAEAASGDIRDPAQRQQAVDFAMGLVGPGSIRGARGGVGRGTTARPVDDTLGTFLEAPIMESVPARSPRTFRGINPETLAEMSAAAPPPASPGAGQFRGLNHQTLAELSAAERPLSEAEAAMRTIAERMGVAAFPSEARMQEMMQRNIERRRAGVAPASSGADAPPRSVTMKLMGEFETQHHYQLVPDNGGAPGNMVLDVSDPKVLKVGKVDSYDTGGPWSFGPKVTRGLLNQIKEQYPNAEWLEGYRISGARAKAGAQGVARLRLRDLSKMDDKALMAFFAGGGAAGAIDAAQGD